MLARVASRSLAASARLRLPLARTIVTKKYTKEHELIAYDSDTRTGTMSISDYAQKSLGQVAFVELPSVGADVAQEENIGTVESTKAASDIYAPISGKVVAINEELSSNPGLINKDPEGAGWLVKIEAGSSVEKELDALLTEEEYTAHCESEDAH
ncbi:glycine cleavage H-protein [Exidia glandulosa HHB12029]|uniref:Glycine cleavage system H protein n=1 Tax=Exidia glandulosa HHB12029 TaxID=1314781 RepID=A0A165PSH7_EXIGL|nr:glycine cleavage H-protein [Exidia glandulosa HHB12029]